MAPNRYTQIIEAIFFSHYEEGMQRIEFNRSEIAEAVKELDIDLPKNLGDVIYSFRYRTALPDSIRAKAPAGREWVIRPAGRARYQFTLVTQATISPAELLSETKIPDATPGVIDRYALSDEQALLAKLRYNRLIDLFTGLTCYSLQSHLRTTVPGMGQVETDEVYVGLDKRGAHYVLPVEAKAGTDKVGIVQIEQDIALCKHRFPDLLCRPVAAQLMSDQCIALFEFEQTDAGVTFTSEKHYRLVRPDELSPQELASYQLRSF